MTFRNTKNTDAHGFAQLLRTEWTKFRKVRGWVIGIIVAALLTAVPGLIIATMISTQNANSGDSSPTLVGPGGEAVTDKFYFVHQTMTGDGSITVRVTSLTGLITYPPPNHDQIVPGVVRWAKAGIIIKDGIKQGTPYAAMMVTGSQGVRMQYNFINDIAGYPGSVSTESPRWLRLTRSGDAITGYESMDGIQWVEVGMAHLAGLPSSVQAGLFVTSPRNLEVSGYERSSRFTNATAVFDNLKLQGVTPSGAWSNDGIGIGRLPEISTGGVKESNGTFTVTGSGDIAALGDEGGWSIERSLFGVFFGLILVIVVAALFATAEYRRNVFRNTQFRGSQGGHVLAAKATVIGIFTFIAGLAAAAVAVPFGKQILHSHGVYVPPAPILSELRVIVGTAALLAVTAVLVLALATMLRRIIPAVVSGIALVVLPYVLANILTIDAAQWLLRLTPAAGFAIQQSTHQYPQVISKYPLTPWAGFAVLCGYTALALGLSIFLLNRRKHKINE
ncbi:ABC-2 family transporter protein [Peptococcaceae bacterium CEB3]|nr:ABC-2 family transporter protein [Peptococcaceae bacterium CEB3]